MATHGAELLAIAKKNNINYLFEASVAGGIPIIHPLYQCLGAGQINEIAGILNGTTNFIMTKMFEDKMSFEKALELAQANGYAEADPSADIEGKDACRKICILASIAYGKHIYPDEVYTQGITNITQDDVTTANAEGYAIKLIARVKNIDGKISAMVSPALVAKSTQLANTSDVFNAVLVRSEDAGDVVFYGRGAGKLPTASAVISDVVDALKEGKHIANLGWVDSDHKTICDYRDDVTSFLIRLNTSDIPKELGKVKVVSTNSQETVLITAPIATKVVESLSAEKIISAIRILEY